MNRVVFGLIVFFVSCSNYRIPDDLLLEERFDDEFFTQRSRDEVWDAIYRMTARAVDYRVLAVDEASSVVSWIRPVDDEEPIRTVDSKDVHDSSSGVLAITVVQVVEQALGCVVRVRTTVFPARSSVGISMSSGEFETTLLKSLGA